MAKLPKKMVQVVLGFEMEERIAKFFLSSSIERVINSSLAIIESQENDPHEFTNINQEDWAEWKPIVVALWTYIHNEVFAELNKIEHESKFFELRKGDL